MEQPIDPIPQQERTISRSYESINPVKKARKRLHLTIDQLCHQAYVSKSLVIKNEQGTYPVPSSTLVGFFKENLDDFDERSFDDEYHDWQRWQRLRNYGVLTPNFPLKTYLRNLPVGEAIGEGDSDPYYHPFEFWRISSQGQPNLNKICKAFCIHQGLLFKFEHDAHLVNSVPAPIIRALMDAGYQKDTLALLEFAYSEYKQYFRNLNIRATIDASYRHTSTVNKLL